MATDNTPPRLRLIVTIAIIMVITLVSLDFVFRSYYAFMSDQAKYEKLAPTQEKTEQRAAEQASLTGAKVSLDQAMAQVAKGTRSDLITPTPSDDMAPMTGWSKMPKHPPLPVLGGGHAAAVQDEAHMHAALATSNADGGVAEAGAPAGDAGARGGAQTKDAGAPKGAAARDAGHAPGAPGH